MSAKMVDANGTVIGVLPLTIVDDAGNKLYEIREGALEGGLRIIAPRADYENHRNMQGGSVASKNFDISAGGDGSSPDQPRGAVVLNRDNGYGTFVGRGRPTRDWAMETRTYDDGTKDFVRFGIPVRLSKPYLYVKDGTTWRKVTL
jgi:hypothetical protein